MKTRRKQESEANSYHAREITEKKEGKMKTSVCKEASLSEYTIKNQALP